MPPLTIPAELKKISPYVRRAEELDKDPSPESRLVSYYCRQYAVHLGIPLTGTSQEAKACLGSLLGSLETEKPAMDNFTRDEAAFLCRSFSNKVFDKANSEDRMGLANKNTAKTFYAASTFLQILEQFSDEGDESEEREEDRKRIVYAKWKSTEILKAIKEGRKPTPGGYGEDAGGDDDEAVDGEDGENGTEAEKREDAPSTTVVETVESDEDEQQEEPDTPAFPSPPPPVPMVPPPAPPAPPTEEPKDDSDEPEEEGTEINLGPPPPSYGDLGGVKNDDAPEVTYNHPPPVEPPAPAPAPKHQRKSNGGGGMFGFGKKKAAYGKASKAQIADAVELTRFALAALEDKDAALGAERLQQALEALGR